MKRRAFLIGNNSGIAIGGPRFKATAERLSILFATASLVVTLERICAERRPMLATGRAFGWLAVLTPRRIWNEDVGDALETIHAMERAGCSRLKIRVKIISTYFWVLIAVIRELVAALTGRKSPHT